MTSPDARPVPCTFCAIVAGELAASVVYEDQATLAFLDIAPATDGHTLVIPKRHADDLLTVTEDDAAAVIRTVRTVASRLEGRLQPDGFTVIQTNRPAGWQDVFHLHVHVVPRWDGDGLRVPWRPRRADRKHLAAVAARLR